MPFSFEGLYEFHGHKCPMSTMGARLGLAAMKALGVTKANQFQVEGRYYTKNCALDGIQYATGCTMGNGNMSFEESGRPLFRLGKRDGGRAVHASISPAALEIFAAHRKMREELGREKEISGLARAMDIDRIISEDFERLVLWVQDAPESEVLVITEE